MYYSILETQLLFSYNQILDTSAVRFKLSITGDASNIDTVENVNTTLCQLGFFHKTLLTTDIQHEYIDAKRFVDLVFILLANTGCNLNQFHISPLSDDTFEITIQYEDSRSTTHAGELTKELLNLCQHPVDFESDALLFLHREIGEFIRYSLINNQDANAKLLSSAARTRNIPVLNLDQPTFKFGYIPNLVMQNGLVQFGYGVNSVKCLGSVPQSFSKVQDTFVFAERPELVSCLAEANIPLNAQDPQTSNCNRLSRALRTAQRITYPVTLRPSARRAYEYREVNNAVFGSIRNDEQLSLAYAYLASVGIKKVAIESFTQGDQYRFLLLKNKVVAVSKLTCPALIGDGIHSVSELLLMQVVQASTAREHLAWKMMAAGDAEIATRLAIEGLQLDSVLEEGRSVSLRGHATPYNGGLTEDVTDLMPERFNTLAVAVANATGLVMLSGVDLIIEDISGDALAPNCVTADIVAEPDLVTHCEPSQGSAVDVSTMILQELFKEGEDGRIPLVAITGTDGKTTTCRMVASIFQANNQVVGLACSDGIYINGEEKLVGDESGLSGAFPLLIDETVEVAVLETAQGGLNEYGIAFEYCDASACLNISLEHVIEGKKIDSLEKLAFVKRQVVERTNGAVTLNGDDSYCLDMKTHSPAKTILLIAKQKTSDAIQEHLKKGGEAITIEENIITLVSNHSSLPIIAIPSIPATSNGAAEHNTSNAMFAIGMAYGLDIPKEVIVKALSNFSMNISNTPGRLNKITGFPNRVLVDAAHTAKAFQSLGVYLDKQNIKGKRILVHGRYNLYMLTIKDVIKEVVQTFDIFILRTSEGCKHDDMINILEAELLLNNVKKENIYKRPIVSEAIELSLSIASPDDFVVITVPPTGTYKLEYFDKLNELEKVTKKTPKN